MPECPPHGTSFAAFDQTRNRLVIAAFFAHLPGSRRREMDAARISRERSGSRADETSPREAMTWRECGESVRPRPDGYHELWRLCWGGVWLSPEKGVLPCWSA